MFAVLSLNSSGIENPRGPDDGHSEQKNSRGGAARGGRRSPCRPRPPRPSDARQAPLGLWKRDIMSRNRLLDANIAITASAVRCPKMELRKKPQKT